jgi:hypothetical protein
MRRCHPQIRHEGRATLAEILHQSETNQGSDGNRPRDAFLAQLEFFHWLSKAKTATTAAAWPALPACDAIVKELEMGTHNIDKAPETWARFVMAPKEAKPSSSRPKANWRPEGTTSSPT